MIETDTMRRDVDVIEADLGDQRLLPFVFTPGADDLHTQSARAKLMPNVLMNNQLTSAAVPIQFREIGRMCIEEISCTMMSYSASETDVSEMHTVKNEIEHIRRHEMFWRRIIDSRELGNRVDCVGGSTYKDMLPI